MWPLEFRAQSNSLDASSRNCRRDGGSRRARTTSNSVSYKGRRNTLAGGPLRPQSGMEPLQVLPDEQLARPEQQATRTCCADAGASSAPRPQSANAEWLPAKATGAVPLPKLRKETSEPEERNLLAPPPAAPEASVVDDAEEEPPSFRPNCLKRATACSAACTASLAEEGPELRQGGTHTDSAANASPAAGGISAPGARCGRATTASDPARG
mmetsp:Transcript_44224/g.127812  ORF Transcript_44224/g.127812 Transcript_44224/m.127812 type:complete len:212 (+) Transcript_44224:276-911(+)